MDLSRLLMTHAAQFGLVACRIAGFVVVSPFPGRNVSARARIGLVVVLSWIAASFAPAPARGVDFLTAAIPEVLCGLLMGVAFFFVFAAAEVFGSVLGPLTGLGTASILNPALDAPETPLGRVVGLAAMVVALGMGVHRIALSALLESFRALPVGSSLALEAPLLSLVDVGVSSFVVGVRMATPVVAVALIVNASLAMISRAAPSLQIFSVGLAVLFAATAATLLASAGDALRGLAAYFQTLPAALDATLTALGR